MEIILSVFEKFVLWLDRIPFMRTFAEAISNTTGIYFSSFDALVLLGTIVVHLFLFTGLYVFRKNRGTRLTQTH